MASIRIGDLSLNLALDRKAMSAIKGGGAPWVFGWIQPYVPPTPVVSNVPIVNLYQTNNSFYANQMNNQFQTIDVANTGSNAVLVVPTTATGSNAA
ncbi:hypothetical protein [Pararobbsia silviterrae]|uniref:Uncharacterized protein n=1 Tax=Pararobbsia silviterrae TaxID=1792498 RepID=A0A494XWH7_9BURK|nr:hypothetical protein [Pararobbsia silviterrae]RKP53336.1 hypothetical protein D7S86_16560 [Pararobbsia silviterrae]